MRAGAADLDVAPPAAQNATTIPWDHLVTALPDDRDAPASHYAARESAHLPRKPLSSRSHFDKPWLPQLIRTSVHACRVRRRGLRVRDRRRQVPGWSRCRALRNGFPSFELEPHSHPLTPRQSSGFIDYLKATYCVIGSPAGAAVLFVRVRIALLVITPPSDGVAAVSVPGHGRHRAGLVGPLQHSLQLTVCSFCRALTSIAKMLDLNHNLAVGWHANVYGT